ncbi:MAG: hypothetical protein WA624_00515 [Methylocella sp.]
MIGVIGIFFFALFGIFATAVSRQLADEFKAWTPRLIKYFIQRAVRQLPESQRKRFSEEWQSHVDEIPGEVGKLIVAFGFLQASSKMSRGLTDATPNMSGQNLNRPSFERFICAVCNNEFLVSMLDDNARTSIEHFIVELKSNTSTAGDFRSFIERRMSELKDNERQNQEDFLVHLSSVLELANELGIPPTSSAFDSYRNGVDAKTLRARYAPLARAAAAAVMRPKGEPQGSP